MWKISQGSQILLLSFVSCNIAKVSMFLSLMQLSELWPCAGTILDFYT
jgi:hypothetical protein